MAVLKPCPRCKRLIPVGWTYCPDCKPIADAEREKNKERNLELIRAKQNKLYNKKRKQEDPKYKQFRNSKAWKETSRAKLDSCEWKCESGISPNCTGLACEVHHIEPLKTPEGWNRRLDWSNLMGVCTAGHNILDEKNFGKKEKYKGVIDLRSLKL